MGTCRCLSTARLAVIAVVALSMLAVASPLRQSAQASPARLTVQASPLVLTAQVSQPGWQICHPSLLA